MKILSLLFILLLSGCSTLFAPPAGTHYQVKYGDIEVGVDDWTDKEGVEFEYTKSAKGETKVILRKTNVDTSTPAAVLQQKQAENQAAAIGVISELIKK